ncbi:unnamed protein product [Gulo gulo]|uniref:Uncharacterized protein n=1 Tax=Gulo gulo TaxID=48420 RepID=A0A9X9LKE4_GULGU|nr:unnamed protein product [Gulo gulo]
MPEESFSSPIQQPSSASCFARHIWVWSWLTSPFHYLTLSSFTLNSTCHLSHPARTHAAASLPSDPSTRAQARTHTHTHTHLFFPPRALKNTFIFFDKTYFCHLPCVSHLTMLMTALSYLS